MEQNRIQLLIGKLLERINDQAEKSVLDLDLMLDYTRVIYADLLDWKTNLQNQEAKDKFGTQILAGNKSHFEAKEGSGIVIEVPIHSTTAPPSTANSQIAIEAETPENTTTIASQNTDEKAITYEPIASNEAATELQAKDFRNWIGINDRYLFMNELFDNNKFDYESLFDFINQCQDKKQAEEWLEKEYLQNKKWNREDKTVELFYGLLHQFFSDFK